MGDIDTRIELKGDVESILAAIDIIKRYFSKEIRTSENGSTFCEYFEYVGVTKKKKATNSDYLDLASASMEDIKDMIGSGKGKTKSIRIYAMGPYGNYGQIFDMHFPYDLAALVLNNEDFEFNLNCCVNDYGDDFYLYVESKGEKLMISHEIIASDETTILEEENVWDIRLRRNVIEGYEDCDTVGSLVEKFKMKKVGFDTRTDILKRSIGYENFISVFNIDQSIFSMNDYDFLFGMWELTRYDIFIDLCKPCSHMSEDEYNIKVQKLKEISIG